MGFFVSGIPWLPSLKSMPKPLENMAIPEVGRPADKKVAHSSGHAATIPILRKMRLVIVQMLKMIEDGDGGGADDAGDANGGFRDGDLCAT